MTELFDLTARKKSSANAQALIWALSITALVFWGVNVYVGKRGPFPGMTIPFFLIAVAAAAWAYWANQRIKCKISVLVDGEKRYHMQLPLKNGESIEVKNVTAIEPFWGYVSQPKGPDRKDAYIRIYDEKGVNTLTLYQSHGAFQDAPAGFKEMDEKTLLTYPKGEHIYYCKEYYEVYRLFSTGKDLEIKY